MGKKSHNNTKTSKVSQGSEVTKKLSLQNRQNLNKIVNSVLQKASSVPTPGSQINDWEDYIEIQKLLQNITTIENIVRSANCRERKSSFKRFYEWLNENEVQYDGVDIADFPGFELGLVAKKDFQEGVSVMKIPRKVMMTEEKARTSLLSEFISTDPMLQNMSNVTLALYLLFEKSNPDSFWKPYIDILPSKYSTVLYFTEKEIETLKPSPVFGQALKFCKCVARQYAYFYNKLNTSNDSVCSQLKSVFSYDNYRWAVSTVMTRQNMIPTIEGKPTAAFIPLWDMCNHLEGKVTTDFNPMSDAGECFAMKDFHVSDQIFIFYGVRCNADLFLHNGFVYPDNSHDEYQLKLGLSSADKLRPLRLELLSKLGLSENSNFALYPGKPRLSPELVAFSRIFCMDKEELDKWISSDERGELLCDNNLDQKSLQFIKTRCQLILTLYGRTDLEANDDDSSNMKLAKILKKIEMKILRDINAYLEEFKPE